MSAQRQFGWSDIAAATQMGNATMRLFAAQSVPFTYVFANWTRLSANAATRIGGVCGLAGSALFVLDHRIAAGLAFAAFLLLDCTDGALARLRGAVSAKGADLDLWTDRFVLFAAALSFSAVHMIDGHMLAAWLCLGYLAAHYVTDLQWLIVERRRANLPPQFAALKEKLASTSTLPSTHLPGWLRTLVRAERSIRPAPWVCNIVFLLGSCFIPALPEVAMEIALGTLFWCIAATHLSNLARRSLRRAR